MSHLVTGATGFLGAALVAELLQRTSDPVAVLVRPGARPPGERFHGALAEAAAAYDLGPEVLAAASRCTVLAGDLTEEGCGLREPLPRGVTHLWHCAASLNYEDRHREEIRATNVEGTRRALALARQLGAGTFNYVSTAYVAGKAPGLIPEVLHEGVETNNHYERSKLDAEQLVAGERGLRARILRPGIVVGHSRTLAATNFSGFYGFLRQLVQFRGAVHRAQDGLLTRTPLRMRVDPDLGLNLIAIDSVARQLAQLGLSDEAEGVYHVTHPAPPTTGLVIRTLFRELGLHEPVFVPTREELGWLDERFDQRLDFYGSYITGDKHFCRRRSDAALGGARGQELTFDEPTISAYSRWYLQRLAAERTGLPAAR